MNQGLTELAKEFFPVLPFKKGISVGCGNGMKEARLVKNGVVEKFDLYELSEKRIEIGRKKVAEMSLSDQLSFFNQDAFIDNKEGQYDFVNWTASLHHMPDVEQALEWTHTVLISGGGLLLDEYVGPNRLQYTQEMLDLATSIRQKLPDKYLNRPDGKGVVSRKCMPANLERLLANDPSEAIDSSRILAALERYFPGAKVIPTGGVVYFIALSDVIANFDEEDEYDRGLLDTLLTIDDLLSEKGMNLRASALARRT